jgi:hypothetical protein
MNRISFSGSISSIHGATVYKHVLGWFVIRHRGAFSSWSGEFTIKSGEAANVMDDYFLLVDDSGQRLGFVLVTRTDSAVIEFMGASSSPVSADQEGLNEHAPER